MDSSHLITNILKSNLVHTNDNLKQQIDQQQTIRSTDMSPNQRSPSNSGESDVDSGIVAIEHNLSRISSGQLPISCELIKKLQFSVQLDNSSNHQPFQATINTESIDHQPIDYSFNKQSQINNQQNNPQDNHQINEQSINHQDNFQYQLNLSNQLSYSNNQNSQINPHFNQIDNLEKFRQADKPNQYFNSYHLVSHANQPNHQLTNQINSHFIHQTDKFINPNQLDQFNHNYLTAIDRLETSDELDSERLRSSCREVLAKINSSKQMSNDAIYANVNSIDQIRSNSSLSKSLLNASPIDLTTNSSKVQLINSTNQATINRSTINKPTISRPINDYDVPVTKNALNCDCLNCEQVKKAKLIQASQQFLSNNNSSNCTNLNALDESNENNLIPVNVSKNQSVNQKPTHIQSESKLNDQFVDSQQSDTNLKRRINQENIKQLLLEALRQKNLEKEALEEKERQLQMYLQERQNIIKEKELECRTVQELSKLNLNNNEHTCDTNGLINGNSINGSIVNSNVINDALINSVQYENTTTVFNYPQQIVSSQTYQNLSFHQSINLNNNNNSIELNNNKNDFTQSCFVQPATKAAENSIDDELITKSFNGGYCSQETRKVLEGNSFGNRPNFKKPETRSSFLQKFSFKFSKAFTKAFFVSDKIETSNPSQSTSEVDNKIVINEDETTSKQIEHQIENPKITSSIEEKTSNFIEKIKSIDTTRSIQETNNKLKNKSIHTLDSRVSSNKNSSKDKIINKEKIANKQIATKDEDSKNKKEKGRHFELNLDEYCIIKKPDLTPPKRHSIDDKKKCLIKKRNSISRKSLNKPPFKNGLTPNNNEKTKLTRHHKSKHQNAQNQITPPKDQSKDQIMKQNNHVIAELFEIHKDGTQVIEIQRLPNRHFGFFFARGKVKNVNGVYVSRMRDEETKRLLTGLLEVGDQILAIDGTNVQDSSIIEVNYLMTNKNIIKLHVKPYTKS